MSFELLILSDSHLFKSRDQKLFGVNTFQSLRKLTSYIKKKESQFDLTVASGDLSEDGQTGGYEDFYHLTQGLSASIVWMSGNHDQFENLPEKLAGECIHDEWHADPWSIIFLNTTIEGKDEGELGTGELSRLEAFLESTTSRYVVILMHHQPIDVGSEFIDVLGLVNKQAFWNIVSRFDHVRCILFGHVHQEFDNTLGGIRLISTPSTSMQFKPHSRELDFDDTTHKYRTISLHQDGSLGTKIHRIPSNS